MLISKEAETLKGIEIPEEILHLYKDRIKGYLLIYKARTDHQFLVLTQRAEKIFLACDGKQTIQDTCLILQAQGYKAEEVVQTILALGKEKVLKISDGLFIYCIKRCNVIFIYMRSIAIKVNFEKDLWNWIQVILKGQSHGISWLRWIPEAVKEKIKGKERKEVAEILRLFLGEKYATEEKLFTVYAEHLEIALRQITGRMFALLEKTTEKPVYRNEFTGFVTTFPRGPYSTKSGYIWFIYGKSDEWQIKACIHELLHMQFEHYYKEKLIKKINEEQFGFLRESMTVILNEEFREITREIDEGYPIHQEFRKRLLVLWKQRQNFSQFIAEAVKHINEFRT